MDREATGFIKKFEHNHAVVWPRDYRSRKALDSPLLFLYDSETSNKPHRGDAMQRPHLRRINHKQSSMLRVELLKVPPYTVVYPLSGTVLSNPPKLHRDYPHAFRLGPPGGGAGSRESVTLCGACLESVAHPPPKPSQS